jgi:hypothetical protein
MPSWWARPRPRGAHRAHPGRPARSHGRPGLDRAAPRSVTFGQATLGAPPRSRLIPTRPRLLEEQVAVTGVPGAEVGRKFIVPGVEDGEDLHGFERGWTAGVDGSRSVGKPMEARRQCRDSRYCRVGRLAPRSTRRASRSKRPARPRRLVAERCVGAGTAMHGKSPACRSFQSTDRIDTFSRRSDTTRRPRTSHRWTEGHGAPALLRHQGGKRLLLHHGPARVDG